MGSCGQGVCCTAASCHTTPMFPPKC
jgi:hypothetical protein